VPVRVGRPAAALRVPLSLGDQPLAGGDESVRRLALAFLAEQAAGSGPSVVPRVRGAIQQSLGTAPVEIGSVARLLAVHPRTLQRRLAADGTAFVELLDDVRRQEARRYLTTTDLPLGQVAGLLGLSEQSALTRCCRRWWGSTPTAVRRDLFSKGNDVD
jgi:AraC-like DNA-binding protein